jgi:hypothetical protein
MPIVGKGGSSAVSGAFPDRFRAVSEGFPDRFRAVIVVVFSQKCLCFCEDPTVRLTLHSNTCRDSMSPEILMVPMGKRPWARTSR